MASKQKLEDELPAAQLEKYLALTSSYNGIRPAVALLPRAPVDPLAKATRRARWRKPRKQPARSGARTLPGASSSFCDSHEALRAGSTEQGGRSVTALRASGAAIAQTQRFERTLRAHTSALESSRGALIAEQAALERRAASESLRYARILEEVRGCDAVQDAHSRSTAELGAAVSIQCVARAARARKAVNQRRKHVEDFVARLAVLTKTGAVCKIQRTYREHLATRLREVRRRRLAEEKLLVRATLQLQRVVRAAAARKVVHVKRQRRASTVARWGEARTRIHQAVEQGVTPAGHAVRNRKASRLCMPRDLVAARELVKGGVGFWLKNMPDAIGAPGSSSRLVTPPGARPASRGKRPGSSASRPSSSASNRANAAYVAEQQPSEALYSTNLTLSGRAAYVEVLERDGMLELQGSYYTSSAKFKVHVSEREFRRFDGAGSLASRTHAEKLSLCAAVCKDLWDTDVVCVCAIRLPRAPCAPNSLPSCALLRAALTCHLCALFVCALCCFIRYSGADSLLESVLIASMPMFSDMKVGNCCALTYFTSISFMAHLPLCLPTAAPIVVCASTQ